MVTIADVLTMTFNKERREQLELFAERDRRMIGADLDRRLRNKIKTANRRVRRLRF